MNAEKGPGATLSSRAIRGWIEAVGDRGVSWGPDVPEAMEWAEAAWRGLRSAGLAEPRFVWDSNLPDRLYALSAVIARDELVHPEHALTSIIACYESLERLEWPNDVLGEKTELLTRFAYLAWRQSRRCGLWPSATLWERRAVELALKQDAVPEFLALSPERRSAELNLRFLSDPAVLLAVCARLTSALNPSPAEAILEAMAVRDWVSQNPSCVGPKEDLDNFLAELELIVAGGAKHCGRYQESRRWLDRVDRRCHTIAFPEKLRARCAFLRLSISFELHKYDEVMQGLPAVKLAFEYMEMANFVARCSYLEATSLKELGRDNEALEIFRTLIESAAAQGEPWLRALAHVSMAELEGREGQYAAASVMLARAWDCVRDSKVPYAVAHFHGIKGEVLRDQGLLPEAVDSYRAAVASYAAARMDSMAAYVRIVLSETLLAAGRDNEATAEIIAALPAIEELELVQEGVAAVALLRESLLRKKADPAALRALRLQIQRMKENDRS
jgi:tetratricopeptide (TPR) repeat protein